MQDIILDVDPDGNIKCLYTDEIDLFAIGRVTNVEKASNIEYHEPSQSWQVISLSGEVLHTNSNREAAIEWEIVAFSPGGQFYKGSE